MGRIWTRREKRGKRRADEEGFAKEAGTDIAVEAAAVFVLGRLFALVGRGLSAVFRAFT